MTKTSVLAGLRLGDDPTVLASADWAATFIRIGGALAVRARQHPADEQLILVVTVPIRDYVCCLIAVGWALTRQPSGHAPVASVASALAPGSWTRASTDTEVIQDRFHAVEKKHGFERVRIGGSAWKPDRLRTLQEIGAPATGISGRRRIPQAGSLAARLSADASWNLRQTSGSPHTLLVGLRSNFKEECDSFVGFDGAPPDKIADILQPDFATDVAPMTEVVSSRNLLDLHASVDKELCLLDGASATRWLDACMSKFVIIAIDRSNIDQAAYEDIRRIRTGSIQRGLQEYGLSAPSEIELSVMTRPF